MAKYAGVMERLAQWWSVLLASSLLWVAASAPVMAADAASQWRNLGWLEGRWSGQERGVHGDGRGQRCYAPVMDGRFLFMQAATRYAPQPRQRHDQHHEQWQLFSRDHDEQRILLRRFSAGGQVMTFVLNPDSSRSDRYVFDSVDFEYAPREAYGRLTLFVGRDDSFRERLELGTAADALEQVSEGRWRRDSHASADCAPAALPPTP